MMRMDTDTFYYLLEKVTPYIAKQNTNFRAAIPAAERLSIALNFLAFGELNFITYSSFITI